MTQSLAKQLAGLESMSMADLKRKYLELFGDETKTGNRTWLVRRIAWRLQANVHGGLSERARQRAAELASTGDADYELADAGSGDSGGVVVSATVGTGAGRGVFEGFAGRGGGYGVEKASLLCVPKKHSVCWPGKWMLYAACSTVSITRNS
jgi:hypothetical protein